MYFKIRILYFLPFPYLSVSVKNDHPIALLEAALLGPLVPTRYSNFRLFTLVVPLTGTGL